MKVARHEAHRGPRYALVLRIAAVVVAECRVSITLSTDHGNLSTAA